MKKPNVFDYHDYREFLKDWMSFKKLRKGEFSLRSLAKDVGASPSYISLIMNGKRKMTKSLTNKMVEKINLNSSEASYFRELVALVDSTSHKARISAISRMQKYKEYKTKKQDEKRVFGYLSKWYNVVIREMVKMNGFELDEEKIQKALRFPATTRGLRESIELLVDEKFLVENESGEIVQEDDQLYCERAIFSESLASFHKQMLQLVSDSITSMKTEERLILGHTAALTKSEFEKIKSKLERIWEELPSEYSESNKKDAVYHVGLFAVPMTKESSDGGKK